MALLTHYNDHGTGRLSSASVAGRRIQSQALYHFADSFVHDGTAPRLPPFHVAFSTYVRTSPLETKYENFKLSTAIHHYERSRRPRKTNDTNDITGNPIFASFPCLLIFTRRKKRS